MSDNNTMPPMTPPTTMAVFDLRDAGGMDGVGVVVGRLGVGKNDEDVCKASQEAIRSGLHKSCQESL